MESVRNVTKLVKPFTMYKSGTIVMSGLPESGPRQADPNNKSQRPLKTGH